MKKRKCKVCGKFQKGNVCKECKLEQPYKNYGEGHDPFKRVNETNINCIF